MSNDHLAVKDEMVSARQIDGGRPGGAHRRVSWGWLGLVGVVLASGGIGGIWLTASGQQHKEEAKRKAEQESEQRNIPKVQIVKPQRGGMERVTSQPGTIRAFEFANLYTKVSGFIKTLNVDRGSRVKKGELLAEIYDPERNVAVIQAQASLEHARAAVAQAEASIMTAQATVLAAKAKQNEAKANLDKVLATRDYRKKEYERISDLVERRSVEPRLKDEELDEYHSAQAAVLAAQAGIETAAAFLRKPTPRSCKPGPTRRPPRHRSRLPRQTWKWPRSSCNTPRFWPPTTASSSSEVRPCTRARLSVPPTKEARANHSSPSR